MRLIRILFFYFAAVFLIGFPVYCEDEKVGIRDFSIETIEKLGRELYRKDALAASAFDLLFEKRPEAKKVKLSGWVTELGDRVSRVYLLKSGEDGVKQGYVVIFADEKDPVIEAHLDEPLPKPVMLRRLARATAIDAIPGFYDRPYNFEVLDDPDGEGFIVYSLVATEDANEVVVGGHTRVTVSADGKKAESVNELSKSLLILSKTLPDAGKTVEGFTMSHIVSNTPIETHVFLSLMHKMPFYVVTDDKIVWKVEKGSISKIKTLDEK